MASPAEIIDPIHRPKHYLKGGTIEPIDFITDRGLNFCEGNIVKYICRWRDKGGLEDLQKAKFYIDALISKETDENQYVDDIKIGGTD